MAARLGLSAAGALAGVGTVVTCVASTGADRGMTHCVCRKARRRVAVAIAALNPRHRNVRRRGHAGRGGAVVAARAVGVGRRVDMSPASPARETRCRAGVAGDAVGPIGRHMARERGSAQRAFRALADIRTVVARIAAAGADRRVIHRVGREACGRIVMAVAALDPCHRNMRRRCHAGCRGAVVAARAIRVSRRMDERSALPAGERRGRARMTCHAVLAAGRHVAGERRRSLRAFRALAGVGAVVAGVAAAGADRTVVHRVGREARRSIGMAVAALDPGHRNVRRRYHTGRRCAVVAARTVGIGGRMGECSALPAGERRGRARMTCHAVLAAGRHVAGERRRALCTFRALTGVGAVVAGIAAAGADRTVVHRVGREACCRIGVAVAALNSCRRNVRRRCHAGRGGAVVAARAIRIGCGVDEGATAPACECRSCCRVARDAIAAAGRDVTRERRRALRAFRALTGVGAIVAGIAAAGADRTVVHRVGREACCRIGVAVAALNSCRRNVRRRCHAGRGGAVVAA